MTCDVIISSTSIAVIIVIITVYNSTFSRVLI